MTGTHLAYVIMYSSLAHRQTSNYSYAASHTRKLHHERETILFTDTQVM